MAAKLEYLTVQEVADLARCEHKSVRRALAASRLEAFHGPGRLLIREAAAREWIEARPVQASTRIPRNSPPRRRRAVAGSVAALLELEQQLEVKRQVS